MGSKVCLNHKLEVSKYIYKISDDININEQIFNLINRDGVTNFFCNDDGSYSFSLINKNYEKVFILIRDNYIYVSSNMDNIRQQIFYKISDEGKFIRINNYSDIESHNNCINRSVFFEKKYDFNGNFVFENKIVETKDNNGENNCSIISKYVVDDEYVRINSFIDYNNPDLNCDDYYVKDELGWNKIDFKDFNSKFADKIEKKGLQKKKSMI